MSLPFLPVRRRHHVKKNLPTAAACVFLLCLCLTLVSCTGQSTKSERQTETPVATQPALLFAGDSIMEGLGPVVAGMLPNQGNLKIVQAGRSSTGLCRPDFYDWPKAMREYMTSLHPKLVVICVGTNDDQSVSDAGKRYHYISPGWQQAYAHKVEEIIDIIAQNGGTSIWVSPPIMGPNYLRPRVFAIKEVIRQTCERRNVVFIDVWQTLADSAGNYQRFIVDSNRKKTALRTKDGVHVTQAGNTLLARAILPQIEQGLSR